MKLMHSELNWWTDYTDFMGVGSKAHTLYSLESLINQSRERIPSRHVFSVKIFSTFITRMQLLANWGKILSEGFFFHIQEFSLYADFIRANFINAVFKNIP
jgi:hypothetical protein